MGDSERPLNDEFAFLDRSYRALADTLPLCLLLKDREGRLRFCNRGFLELAGKRLDEIVGKTDHDLFPAHLAEAY